MCGKLSLIEELLLSAEENGSILPHILATAYLAPVQDKT